MPSKNAPSRKKSLGYYAKVKKGGGRGKKAVKSYNSLYQNFNILNSESKESTSVRLLISLKTRDVISLCSELLGIDLPNKM